jgi:ADP-ribosylglycohydrolase
MPVNRAQGCLLGQLAGDALGSLVEFQSPEEIRRNYPEGVRELADGGTWNTIALCANISETSSPCQIEVGRVGDLGYG